MDLEYLPEEVKKELNKEFNSILTKYKLAPIYKKVVSREKLEENVAGFKLGSIKRFLLNRERWAVRYKLEIDSKPIIKLIEELKNKELQFKLNYNKSLEEKGRDIYVDWKGNKYYEYKNRKNDLSIYDLSILRSLEAIVEREFSLNNIREKSEMTVCINDRKITGISIQSFG